MAMKPVHLLLHSRSAFESYFLLAAGLLVLLLVGTMIYLRG